LTWSHYVELLHLSPKKANYYIYLVTHNNLSIRELRTRIKNKEYDRLYDNLNSDLNNGKRISGDTCIKDVIKNPLFVRNSVSENKLPEFEIHNLILDDIKEFSSKLNTSYSIIGIEYDVLFDDNKYSIDLLLYSVKYNCYIVVLLKSGSFKSDYIF
jgi:predicted nuclease of restriction endonuclease-like (RecB) superfamily